MLRPDAKAHWVSSLLPADEDPAGKGQDLESGNRLSPGDDWQHGYEVKQIKPIIGSHLMEVRNVHPTEWMFLDFSLSRPIKRQLFGRILHLEGTADNVEQYEFLLPQLKTAPVFRSALGKDVQALAYYYFYIPLFVSEHEMPEFDANKSKINEKGFILRTSDRKYLLQQYPQFHREKLPWLAVVSSSFVKGSSQKALDFLFRMAVGDQRILINYKPMPKYTLKEKLSLDVGEATAYVREAPNLDWALEYLNSELTMMLNTPFAQLFKQTRGK